MKKGRIIDTNKLILRILITFLGTAGVSSVFVSVTENYAGPVSYTHLTLPTT